MYIDEIKKMPASLVNVAYLLQLTVIHIFRSVEGVEGIMQGVGLALSPSQIHQIARQNR